MNLADHHVAVVVVGWLAVAAIAGMNLAQLLGLWE